MIKADHSTTTTTPDPDRELIELAGRFSDQEIRHVRTLYAMPEGPAADRALARIKVGTDNPHFARLQRMRPTTRAGLQAMARAALLEDPELHVSETSAGVTLLVTIALSLLDGENPYKALHAELGDRV